MNEKDNEVENIIYTDFIGTKLEINNYAMGWLKHYSNYLMPGINDYSDELGMIKYAIRFISKTKQSYIDFKNKFEINEIETILDIYRDLVTNRNKRLSSDKYFFINEFIYKYLHVTGMDKIDTEKRDLGKTVLRTR